MHCLYLELVVEHPSERLSLPGNILHSKQDRNQGIIHWLYTILMKSSRVQQDQMEMNKYTVQKAIGYHPMLLVSVVTIFSDWLSPFLHLSLLK